MVTTIPNNSRHRAGLLMSDLLVGMALLCLAIVPIATSLTREKMALHNSYHRAVAMEIVDGEMELLVAGGWHSYSNGVHQLAPRAKAAANLPPGKFQLTVAPKHLRLEWRPARTAQGGVIYREITLK